MDNLMQTIKSLQNEIKYLKSYEQPLTKYMVEHDVTVSVSDNKYLAYVDINFVDRKPHAFWTVTTGHCGLSQISNLGNGVMRQKISVYNAGGVVYVTAFDDFALTWGVF